MHRVNKEHKPDVDGVLSCVWFVCRHQCGAHAAVAVPLPQSAAVAEEDNPHTAGTEHHERVTDTAEVFSLLSLTLWYKYTNYRLQCYCSTHTAGTEHHEHVTDTSEVFSLLSLILWCKYTYYDLNLEVLVHLVMNVSSVSQISCKYLYICSYCFDTDTQTTLKFVNNWQIIMNLWGIPLRNVLTSGFLIANCKQTNYSL